MTLEIIEYFTFQFRIFVSYRVLNTQPGYIINLVQHENNTTIWFYNRVSVQQYHISVDSNTNSPNKTYYVWGKKSVKERTTYGFQILSNSSLEIKGKILFPSNLSLLTSLRFSFLMCKFRIIIMNWKDWWENEMK